MIHVDLSQLRKLALRTEMHALDSHVATINGLATDQERRDFIDGNGDAWSAIRHRLWVLGHFKCWYSEAKLLADEGEVEHFRPKKQVWKTTPAHGGYWWRAFDWQNFRLAHPNVNKRKKDYSTEQVAGKGCYFPLRDEARRATRKLEEKHEEPVLLDPILRKDTRLLCFDSTNGRPLARYKETDDPDGWRHLRATETIGYYHLDEGSWNADRADIMMEVQNICDNLLEAKAAGDIDKYEDCLDQLSTYVGCWAEFTSAAKQAISEKLPFDIFVL